MTVYVVISYWFSSWELMGVYRSQKDADAYVARAQKETDWTFEVIEKELE